MELRSKNDKRKLLKIFCYLNVCLLFLINCNTLLCIFSIIMDLGYFFILDEEGLENNFFDGYI